MGGCRLTIFAIALAIAIPFLAASAGSPVSLQKEPVPIRFAILHGPVPVSGIVVAPWSPTAGTGSGPLLTAANATLLPVPLIGRVIVGGPMRCEPGEDKTAFLARARDAMLALKEA